MSDTPFPSSPTRLLAKLWKATVRPVVPMALACQVAPGPPELALPPLPLESTLAFVVCPASRSRTNTSAALPVSVTSGAAVENAM
jgi:hypothetical protein